MLSIRLQRDKELTLKTIYVVLLCESRSHGPSFVWVSRSGKVHVLIKLKSLGL